MTNKMPVVGKIYNTTTKKGRVYVGHKDSEVLGVNKGLVWYFENPIIFSYEKREYYHYEIVTIDRFWSTHEELPEDNLQETTRLTAITETDAVGTYTININSVAVEEEPILQLKALHPQQKLMLNTVCRNKSLKST